MGSIQVSLGIVGQRPFIDHSVGIVGRVAGTTGRELQLRVEGSRRKHHSERQKRHVRRQRRPHVPQWPNLQKPDQRHIRLHPAAAGREQPRRQIGNDPGHSLFHPSDDGRDPVFVPVVAEPAEAPESGSAGGRARRGSAGNAMADGRSGCATVQRNGTAGGGRVRHSAG